MKILKIFNNNIVAAEDTGRDIIVTGAGIGFQKKRGDTIDRSQIEKTYLFQSEKIELSKTLHQELPQIYFEMTEYIVDYATKQLKTEFSGEIFLAISDHISFAIKRSQDGVYIPNVILQEIRALYPEEYAVGKEALRYIAKKTNVQLTEDEAGYIALHLVNFSLDHNANNATSIMVLIKRVIDIIQDVMNVDIEKDLLQYSRIVTHLKYLAERILRETDNNPLDTTEDIRDFLQKNDSLNECVQQIAQYIAKEYNYELTPDEETYLSIHIHKYLS